MYIYIYDCIYKYINIFWDLYIHVSNSMYIVYMCSYKYLNIYIYNYECILCTNIWHVLIHAWIGWAMYVSGQCLNLSWFRYVHREGILIGWWFLPTPLKNMGQLGWLFPIYGKITHIPNHQDFTDPFVVSCFHSISKLGEAPNPSTYTMWFAEGSPGQAPNINWSTATETRYLPQSLLCPSTIRTFWAHPNPWQRACCCSQVCSLSLSLPSLSLCDIHEPIVDYERPAAASARQWSVKMHIMIHIMLHIMSTYHACLCCRSLSHRRCRLLWDTPAHANVSARRARIQKASSCSSSCVILYHVTPDVGLWRSRNEAASLVHRVEWKAIHFSRHLWPCHDTFNHWFSEGDCQQTPGWRDRGWDESVQKVDEVDEEMVLSDLSDLSDLSTWKDWIDRTSVDARS